VARAELVAALIRGEFAVAIDAADRMAGQTAGANVPSAGRILASTVVYRALLHFGRPAEALARLDDVMRSLELPTEPPAVMGARLVTLAAASSDGEHARAVHDLLSEYEPDDEGESWPTHLFLACLEAAIAVSDAEHVERLYKVVEPAADLAVAHVFLACPARILGEAAAFLGRCDEAGHWFERAIEIAGRISFRPEVALAHSRLGELQLKHYPDERADALAHLDFAIAEFEAMGMQPALDRALRLRGRRRAARDAKEPLHADGLTEREVEVLRLIAAGKSNRDIAEGLVLSVRTVERHITNIYAKIDARGKADATTYALRHALI
jgi:DNA-binding CsgD family transcriptional regulator